MAKAKAMKLRSGSRWGDLTIVPYQTLIGGLLVLTGIIDLMDLPTAVQEEQRGAGMVLFTAVGYFLSGLMMLWGLWRQQAKVEAVSHLILVNVVLTSTLASILYRNKEAFQDSLVFFLILFAAGVRLHRLLRKRRLIEVEIEPNPVRAASGQIEENGTVG